MKQCKLAPIVTALCTCNFASMNVQQNYFSTRNPVHANTKFVEPCQIIKKIVLLREISLNIDQVSSDIFQLDLPPSNCTYFLTNWRLRKTNSDFIRMSICKKTSDALNQEIPISSSLR